MAVGCIPIIAICRKLRILNWNYAKQVQAEMGGHTESTAKFIRSVSSMNGSDENGQILDDVKPYTDDPVTTNGKIDGVVSFT